MSDENIVNNSTVPDLTGGVEDTGEDFAAMLDKSTMGGRLYPGQKVRAKVVSVSNDLVYIDLGGKSEGAVDLSEFINEEGTLCVHEGDEIDAFFVNAQDGLMKLTTFTGGYSAITLNGISSAYEAGIPVNGEVKKETKGGYEVSVGGVRCFCPFSHIDLKGSRNDIPYTGQTFPFKILEYAEGGKKIVLSRRAILEQEREAKVTALKESLSVGMEVNARVKSIHNYGVFVDLGCINGLIPLSEVSWDRSINPGDILSIGQDITAKIISIDWEKNRIALSLKAMQADPWDSAEEKYPVDSMVSGAIARLTPFGAFVNLEPGIDGLIHISNLGAGKRINHPREVVEPGQLIEAHIISVDRHKKRIALSMQPKVTPEKVVLPSVGEILNGTVEKVMPYGIFLKISNGITGLLPSSEMGTPSGTDHRRMFPPGIEMQVTVIEVDTEANKVRLSRKSVLDKASQDEFSQYQESLKNFTMTSGNLGRLGDILKTKLEEKNLLNKD
jgi:small subunit ribosomal protein S1